MPDLFLQVLSMEPQMTANPWPMPARTSAAGLYAHPQAAEGTSATGLIATQQPTWPDILSHERMSDLSPEAVSMELQVLRTQASS